MMFSYQIRRIRVLTLSIIRLFILIAQVVNIPKNVFCVGNFPGVIGNFCRSVWNFCRSVWNFCRIVGNFCGAARNFCRTVSNFCRTVGNFSVCCFRNFKFLGRWWKTIWWKRQIQTINFCWNIGRKPKKKFGIENDL